jgi:hypothetical protein
VGLKKACAIFLTAAGVWMLGWSGGVFGCRHAPIALADDQTERIPALGAPAAPETQEIYQIRPLVGNIRQAPSLEAPILFQLEAGTRLVATGKKGEWFAIRMADGRTGWAHQTILTHKTTKETPSNESEQRGIKAIRLENPAEDTVHVNIELGGFYPPAVWVMEGSRPRIICDFNGVGVVPGVGSRLEFDNSLVASIRVGQHSDPVKKVRVVVDLVGGPNYSVEQLFFEKESLYRLVIKREGGG